MTKPTPRPKFRVGQVVMGTTRGRSPFSCWKYPRTVLPRGTHTATGGASTSFARSPRASAGRSSASGESREHPDICASRHRGNPESVAANPARARKGETQLLILAHLRRNGPLTVKELAQIMGTTSNCISGRLTELKCAGEVVKTLLRRDGAAVVEAL